MRPTGLPLRVGSKAAMYSLYEGGAFGNKLKTWRSPADLNGHAGTVSLRYAGRAGGGFAAYDVAVEDVPARVAEWVDAGADASLVRVNESAPDERLTIQGEVVEWAGGLALRFSDFRGKMREAMKFAEHVYGLEAITVLRHFLTAASYNDVCELMQMFPGSVVEFSAYEMCLGDCRGRNAVIWEVRCY